MAVKIDYGPLAVDPWRAVCSQTVAQGAHKMHSQLKRDLYIKADLLFLSIDPISSFSPCLPCLSNLSFFS